MTMLYSGNQSLLIVLEKTYIVIVNIIKNMIVMLFSGKLSSLILAVNLYNTTFIENFIAKAVHCRCEKKR